MGGCASVHLSQGQRDDRVCAEWSELYDSRIAKSLYCSSRAPMGKGAVARPLLKEVSPSCHAQRTDDKHQRQTIFFFDWDDTLFPTTWARLFLQSTNQGQILLPLNKQQAERLKDVSSRMVSLLSEAQTLGEVVIVTNASRCWVAACCSNLMPEALAMLQRIPWIYAMESLSAWETRNMPKRGMCTECKTRAMRAALSTFHQSNSAHCGCINVVCIGDSDCERDAVREAVRSPLPGKDISRRCFTKTIKMLRHPSVLQMHVQLSAISKRFSEIVHADVHVNIDLGKRESREKIRGS